MSWDGGGTFDRDYNFSADASAGIQALPARFDGEFDNFKEGLENCVTVDGQNSPTADLPMGGNKHTGVAAATSADHYVRVDQYVKQTPIYLTAVQTTANDILSATPNIYPGDKGANLTHGSRYILQVPASTSVHLQGRGWRFADSASAIYLALTSMSASPWVLRDNNDGLLLRGGQLRPSGVYDLVFDASTDSFRVLNPQAGPTNVQVSVSVENGGVQTYGLRVSKQGSNVTIQFPQNLFSVSASVSGQVATFGLPSHLSSRFNLNQPIMVDDASSWGDTNPTAAYTGNFRLEGGTTCYVNITGGVASTSAVGWEGFAINYLASTGYPE